MDAVDGTMEGVFYHKAYYGSNRHITRAVVVPSEGWHYFYPTVVGRNNTPAIYMTTDSFYSRADVSGTLVC